MNRVRFEELKNTYANKIEEIIEKFGEDRKISIPKKFIEAEIYLNEYELKLTEKACIEDCIDIESRLKLKLPKSYTNFITNVGLMGFKDDAFSMLDPISVNTLSAKLEEEWKVNWSKEHPLLKQNTDRLIVFSLGDSSQQQFYYICLDYRLNNNNSNEVPLFYFSQDEIWNEDHFSQLTEVVNEDFDTMEKFIASGIETQLDNLLGILEEI